MYIYVALLIGWMRCASHAVSYQLVATLTISGTTENTMRGPHRGLLLFRRRGRFNIVHHQLPKSLPFPLLAKKTPNKPRRGDVWGRRGSGGGGQRLPKRGMDEGDGGASVGRLDRSRHLYVVAVLGDRRHEAVEPRFPDSWKSGG
ncbi:unnamed protein product [Musa hybrid cultivar]